MNNIYFLQQGKPLKVGYYPAVWFRRIEGDNLKATAFYYDGESFNYRGLENSFIIMYPNPYESEVEAWGKAAKFIAKHQTIVMEW